MRREALTVHGRQRRNRSCGVAELTSIRRAEQEAQISRATELVDAYQTRAELGACRKFGLLQRRDVLGRSSELGLNGGDVAVELPDLFGLELAFDFELPQVPENGAFFRCEPIRLALQRLKPVGRAPRERLGPCAFGRLRGGRKDRKDGKDRKAGKDRTGLVQSENYTIGWCAFLASTSASGASVWQSAILRAR